MSCDRNGSRIANLCAARSGISRAGSKAAGALGTALAGLQQQAAKPAGSLNKARVAGLRQIGRASGAVLEPLNAIEGPKSLERLIPLAVVGAIASDVLQSRQQKQALLDFTRRLSNDDDDDAPGTNFRPRIPNYRNRALNTFGALQLTHAIAGGAGTSLARLSKTGEATVQQRNYFGGRTVVRSWPSRLSRLLNAADVPPGLTVTSSSGRMLESRGKAWHAGATVVKSAAGERAITHLQSMTWPAQHYYFKRALSDQELAGIISNHQDFEAKYLPGYAGEIGEVEGLLPGAASLKRGLIKSHLFWGEPR